MDVEQIKQWAIESIESWAHDEATDRWDDALFSERAVRLFAYQFEHNQAYRLYCQRRGVTPDQISHYRDIPEVPTDVFKTVELTTTPSPSVCFKTSGTTQGQQGVHWMEDASVYAASMMEPFRRYALSDPRLADASLVLLHPHRDDLPHSSLSYMLTEFERRLFQDVDTTYAVGLEQGEWVWALEAFVEHLDEAQRSGRPVCVLGTAFGWMTVLDNSERSWQLPPGSMVMETGGFKGRSREVSRSALYDMFTQRLGIDPTHCISEYSMTELSAQAYTDNLRAWHTQSRSLTLDARAFRTPPWAKVEAVDPQTMRTLGAGERGLLRWYDLSNVWSVSTIQTSDVGVVDGNGGFKVLGRARGAELRGCSMSIEEMKRAIR